MDFTQQLADQKGKETLDDSEGVARLDDIQNQEKAEEDKRQDGKFTSAFGASDLSEVGPTTDEFDYNTEFMGGNSFKPGADGGITLNNTNIKPLTREIAGHDAVTGKKFFDQYADEEGYIQEGMGVLRESKMNTVTGAPPDDLFPLSKIANGVMLEDKTYEDFLETVGGSWSDQQKKVAWDSAKAVKETKQNIQDFGARYLKENADVKYVRSEGVQEDIEETELVSSPTWIQSGKTVMEHFNPGGGEGMTEQEVHDFNLNFMSNFNYNIPMMMFYTYEIANAKDPELAKAFLFLMDQNDATDVSWAAAGRGFGGVMGDITTYATLGGGILLSRTAAIGMRMGLRKVLTKLATVTAAEVALGATEGAVADISRQTIEGAAGEREELDVGRVAASAGIAAGITAGVGAGAATLGDPVLRKFGMDAVRKAHKNLTKPVKKGMLHMQRGTIGVDMGIEHTPVQVEFRSRLGDEIDKSFGKKPNISVKKLKNRIKGWLGEGKIKQEEVDWAGINFLDDSDTITKAEMKAYLEQTRPVPSITPVATTKFDSNSLGNPESGYRERIISVGGQGDYFGPGGHFAEESPVGRANVGHIRLATSKSGGKKGTMLLEGQADIRKEPRYTTVARTREGKAIKLSKDEIARADLNKNLSKITNEIEDYIGYLMDEHQITDVTTPAWQTTAMRDPKYIELLKQEVGITARLNEIEYSILREGQASVASNTPFTPYRAKKSSNDLMFRSAVMDAMNDGSEFLAWPKTAEQISIIEQWGETAEVLGVDSIVKQYDTDFPKIAKAHGFKVEEYVPDEFKGGGKFEKWTLNDGVGDIIEFKSKQDLGIHLVDIMQERMTPKANGLYDYYDIEGDLLLKDATLEQIYDNAINAAKELMGFDISITDNSLKDNKFYRIVFDDAAKAKWRKEGAAMYSFGAPVAISEKKKQERDSKGQFK